MNKAPPIRHVFTCAYCPNKLHIIDPKIYPNDVIAQRQEKGWKCGDCIEEEIQNMIKANKKRRGIS
jgi:hypothetical protein